MAADLQQSSKAAVSARGLMPPYLVLRDFLGEDMVAGLLAHAMSHQSDFAPTGVFKDGVNPARRISTSLRHLGPFRDVLREKIFALLPTLVDALRVTPFAASSLELELVAHGDGAFYKRHIDTQTAIYGDVDSLRILSGVYYFNAEPKAFSGGALRLYAIGGEARKDFSDIEPLRNSLLMFPSWASHEVRPVCCPSKAFIASRFAINCWIHRKKLTS